MYPPEEPLTLNAEHPFVSSIFDEQTNNPLFISTLIDPTQTATAIQSEKRTGPLGNNNDNSGSACVMPSWSLFLQLVFLTMGILLV